MYKLLSRINVETINNFALLLLAFSISFPQRIIIYTIAFWILTCLLILKFNAVSKLKEVSSLPLLILALLFLCRAFIAICHSDFSVFASKQLFDTQLALLVLPVVLIFHENKRTRIDKVLLTYVIGCFVSSLVVVVYFYLFRFGVLDSSTHLLFIPLRDINSTFADDINLFQGYCSPFFKHRAGIGACLSMAVACLVYLAKKQSSLKPWRWIGICLTAVFFVCVIYATGSRSGLLSLVTVLVIALIYLLSGNKKMLVFGFLLIGLLLFGSMSLKTTRSLLVTEISSLDYNKIRTADPRFKIWESASDIIKEHPFVGVGYSRVNSQLVEKYRANGLTEFANERFNSHNQFLQFSLESGVWAGVFFAIFLLPIYFGRKNRYLSFSFSAIFFFYSMFEDSLILINGVSLLVFFVSVLYLSEKERNNKLMSFEKER
jgi:O-antigen ligase